MGKPRSFARLMLNGYGVIGAFGLIFLVIFGTISWLTGRESARLAGNGADAVAEIVGKRIEDRRTNGNNDTQVRRYYLTYVFEVDGVSFEDRDFVPREDYAATDLGDTRPVRYWREDPNVSALDPDRRSTESRTTGVIATIAGAIALFGFFVSARRARGYVRLRRQGVRRRAVVTELKKARNKPNKVPRYSVVWRDDAGSTGISTPLRKAYVPDVGDEIFVYADPHGDRSVWEYELFHLPRRRRD